jgi:hypothetical protein
VSDPRRERVLRGAAVAVATLVMGTAELPAPAGAAPPTPARLASLATAALSPTLANPQRLAWLGLASPTPLLDQAAGVSRSKLPPDLIALERKMQTLHINSERIVAEEIISGPSQSFRSLFGIFGGGRSAHKRPHSHVKILHASLPQPPKLTIPFLTIDAEVSHSPRLAIVRGVLLGVLSFQAREIGEQLYLRVPLLTGVNGGKPWVYISPAERAKERAAKRKEAPSPLSLEAGGPESDEASPSGLTALLARARSVVEIGERTVDGQRTTEFIATFGRGELLGKRRKRGSKGATRILDGTKATLNLFLAPDGLPVRIRYDLRIKGGVSLLLATDVLATEILVSVQPPPASETISEEELVTIERARARRLNGWAPRRK